MIVIYWGALGATELILFLSLILIMHLHCQEISKRLEKMHIIQTILILFLNLDIDGNIVSKGR